MKKLVAMILVAASFSAVLVGHTVAGEAKVSICHIPPGNPANQQTIRVGPAAVNAHLAHGDHVGACGGTPIPLPLPGGMS